MVFDDDFFNCYLNDERMVYGYAQETNATFDIVNIYYWGKNAYYDDLRVYNNNATAMRMINTDEAPKFSYPKF